MVDETIVRRQMSVDFELPMGLNPVHVPSCEEPVFYAPLFFLQKGSDEPFDPRVALREPEPHFANFDFRDERGTALTLPPRSWNARITAAMLSTVIAEAAERLGKPLGADQQRNFKAFARILAPLDRRKAEARVNEIRRGESQDSDLQLLRDLDRRDLQLQWVLDAVVISSVVMVPLLELQARGGIRKLSYDHQISPIIKEGLQRTAARFGWTGYELWVETPFIGSSNFHFEFEAPRGVEVFDAGIFEVSPANLGRQPSSPSLARLSGLASRLHLYAAGTERRHKAVSWVRLRVRRQDFVGGAVVAAAMVVGVLWSAYALRNHVVHAPRDIPLLLLLFPTAIGAYVVRPGGHRLTVRMLLFARVLLAISSALPFVAVGALAVVPRKAGALTGTGFMDIWLGCAITATVCLVGLLLAWALPAPEIAIRRWERRLRLDVRRTNRQQYDPHPEPLLPRLREWFRFRRNRRSRRG